MMLTQTFISIVMPLVFSALLAAFGWFADEESGAIIAGVSSFIAATLWSIYCLLDKRMTQGLNKASATSAGTGKSSRRHAALVRLLARRMKYSAI